MHSRPGALDYGFRRNDTLFYRTLSPMTGRPPSEPYSVTIWSDEAVKAAAFAEASLAIGEVEARRWLAEFGELGSFFVSRYEDSYIGEADPKMSEWISMDVD